MRIIKKLIRAIIIWLFIWYCIYIISIFTWKVEADYIKITYDNLYVKWFKKPPFKLYSRLKNECFKQEARNKEHCIKIWLSIAYAESSWKDNHTPFWLQSKEKGFNKWVKSYNLYWYKAKNQYFFYWKDWKKPKSNYCLSEESSWSQGWCPNGWKNFAKIFYNLTF